MTRRGVTTSLFAAGAALAALYGSGMAVARTVRPGDVAAWPFVACVAWGGCLAAAAVVWRSRRTRDGAIGAAPQPLVIVLAFAALFRVQAAVAPADLSSDLNRYLWDGRVQAAGTSSYAFAPGDPALRALRDSGVHARINRPEAMTVYPPGAQALFAALHAAGVRTQRALRLVAATADFAGVVLLALLLRRRGDDPARVVLYAWSPLAVMEHAGNAHLEAFVVPLVAAALLLDGSRRRASAGVVAGLAALVKLTPGALLVALHGRGAARTWLAAAVAAAAAYGVYGWWSGAEQVLGFLPRYAGSAEDFNVGLRAFVEPAFAAAGAGPNDARTAAFVVCVALLVASLAALARRARDPDPLRDGAERAYLAFAAVVFLAPTALHAWYATPLLALAAVASPGAVPRAASVWLAVALPLSYLKYAAPDGLMPAWIAPLEFLPAYALVVVPAALRVVRGAASAVAVARAAA